MNENEITVAAFAKMVRGEPLSLSDAQRVWQVVLNNGRNIDTGNQNAAGKFISELKNQLLNQYFPDGM